MPLGSFIAPPRDDSCVNQPPGALRLLSDGALSEIIGSILLILIVVAVCAVLMTVVLSQPLPGRTPALAIAVTNQSTLVSLSHAGGDSLKITDYYVLINGVKTPFSGYGSDGTWSVGETLTASSSALPGVVSVVYNGSNGATVLFSTNLNAR